MIMRRLLLSSIGSKTPLINAALTSLMVNENSLEIWVSDLNPSALGLLVHEKSFVLPETSDQNLEFIGKILVRNRITHVLPTRDTELEFWARNSAYFNSLGVIPLTSGLNAINICYDKLKFSHFLEEHGFPSIQTSENLTEISADTYVLKERFGAGSEGVVLDVEASKLINKIPSFRNPIFQPYIAGREFSADVWLSQDKAHGFASLRWRTVVHQGESKVTETFIDVDLSLRILEIARIIGLSGISVFQGLQTMDKSVRFIECNSRVGGATSASIYAGIPIIDLLIMDSENDLKVDFISQIKVRNLIQIRTQVDKVIYDPCL
jgi:carbamoyl-phosphate synthase large subunit